MRDRFLRRGWTIETAERAADATREKFAQLRQQADQRKRYVQAKRALPRVYGEPTGTEAEMRAVRMAKAHLAAGESPSFSMREAARVTGVGVSDLVSAVLRMKGGEAANG